MNARGLICMAGVVVLAGCSSSPQPVERRATRGLEASERYVGSPDPGAKLPPPALLDQTPITWDELRPRMVEAGGAAALEELVLERQLEREAARLGLSVSDDDLRAERQRLAEVMSVTGATGAPDANEAQRVIERMRRERGLGDVRFASLLRRTALMRKIVQPEVAVTPAALDQAYQMRFGERFQARVITLATAADASRALDRARAGEPFEQLAIELSTDVSAVRGGLVEPISPVDPLWPASLREALATLQPGQVAASPVAIENGFAVVKLEQTLASPSGAPDMASVRADLEREVRVRQERLLMARLARRLLDEARLSIVDPGLRGAWERDARP